MATEPRNRVTEHAMIEEVCDALLEGQWPTIEAEIRDANTQEAIEEWDRLWRFLEAKKKYEVALKARDAEALVSITANADLRRELFQDKLRSRGSPKGSRNPENREQVKDARSLLASLKAIWPSLCIPGLPSAYDTRLAHKIVETLLARVNWALPPGWYKTH